MSKTDEFVVGVAWYRREQWAMLRVLSADADTLEETYDEWVEYASHQIRDFESKGIRVRKIDVEMGALTRWCEAEGRVLDAEARAEYARRELGQHHC